MKNEIKNLKGEFRTGIDNLRSNVDMKIDGLHDEINLLKAKQVEMKGKSQEIPTEVKLESKKNKTSNIRWVPLLVFKHQF